MDDNVDGDAASSSSSEGYEEGNQSHTFMDTEALKRISLSRQRVENSWEDISSDEGEGGDGEDGEEGKDGWEDADSSGDDGEDGQDSESATSNATTTKAKTSSKQAFQDYKQSKRALMMSESNNMERYKRLMSGDTPADDKELKRTDTAEELKDMEPFSAGRGTESFDQTEGISRAHEIYLPDEEKRESASISRRKSTSQLHSHNGSNSNSSRLPYLDARTTSRSPSVSKALMELDNDQIELDRGQNGHVKEFYASEPVSPSTDQDIKQWNELQPPRPGNFNHTASFTKIGSAFSLAVGLASKATSTETKQSGDYKRDNERLSSQLDELADAAPPYSLWDYLKEEVMATDFDSTQELKWERVTNFIAIPFWMEKIMVFGFAVCLDSFLYTFTILPLRSLVAFIMWVRNTLVWMAGGQKRYLHSSHKCDILKALLIILSCFILSQISDASKMYHSVRGQDVVKLYVIFNVLEIADRLCCSFGQDLLDSLFSRLTLARRKDGRQPYLRPLGFFLLSLGYVLAHTLVLFYQLVTLNVAINSYDNALLTLLLSNQFVEIKGSVFKKFEKENLFQLTCADIVERFQLTLMLSAIGLRNLIEVAGATPSPMVKPASQNGMQSQLSGAGKNITPSSLNPSAIFGPLPTSFTVFPSFSLLETTFTPVCIVLASECLVDWLKHAFITKFNHIRPSVYGRFMDVLCRDLTIAGRSTKANTRRRHTFVDQSPVVSRRLGFAAIPLACLLVRMTSQILGMLQDDSHFDECARPNIHQHEQNGDNQTLSYIMIVGQALRSSIIFTVKWFVKNADTKVDLALNYIFSASAWILTIFIAWILCVSIKEKWLYK